jgi:hypothetical protein
VGGDTLEADADLAVVGARIEQAAFCQKTTYVCLCCSNAVNAGWPLILWERSFASVVNTGKQMKPQGANWKAKY